MSNFILAFLRSKWLVVGFLSLLGILIPFLIFSATIFEDNFEDYELGNLAGQGDWIGSDRFQVQNEKVFEGLKGVSVYTSGATITKIGTQTDSGAVYIFFNLPENSGGFFQIYLERESGGAMLSPAFTFTCGSEICLITTYDFVLGEVVPVGEVPVNVWFAGGLLWSDIIDKIGVVIYPNTAVWVYPEEAYKWATGKIRIGTSLSPLFYFDNIVESPEIPLNCWVDSPPNETEITNLQTNLTFKWSGLEIGEWYEPGKWKGLEVGFYEKYTGIFTKFLQYEGLESSGQKTITLINFGFDKNSDYYFVCSAFKTSFDLLEFVWRSVYSGNLVEDYFLKINIEGFEWVFKMSNPQTWYTEHSPYASSTALFTNFTGFLDPIFSRIGEFGNRATSYFDIETAYNRGFEIGKVFPIFSAYISNIDYFFGGFPVKSMVLIFFAVLIGIFIFKLVMKFLPLG